MWLQSLKIKHFRNYKEADIDFHPGLNVFLGQNAQGKTNILEAVYFLALTRSHRTRSDKDLIHFTDNDLLVSGILEKKTGKVPLDINLTPKGRITKVNHLKQSKLSDYIGTMNVVLFAPEDLQLVKGSPSLRRKFIDIDLGQIKPVYLSDLSSYNHVLKQRNAYLKSTDNVDINFLSVLDEQLSDFGARVIEHRLEFIKQLEEEADRHHSNLSNQIERLKISYESNIPLENNKVIRESFLTTLKQNHKRDIFKKNTGVGPHRDDLTFYINDMNASFGSQGQQRSLILSLKMAEIALIKKVTGEFPILLLDDVMSELDNHRQLKLLESIDEEVQTFMTTTSLDHLSNLPPDLKTFLVNNGDIYEKQVD